MIPAKKVITKDLNGNENGYLIELSKRGNLTASYLSCAYPGAFKGYHLHKVREANYICIKGKIKIILYKKDTGREEHILSADSPSYFNIPKNVPTGLSNEGDEEAWIINYPTPYYDPELEGEQVDYNEEQLEALFGKEEKVDLTKFQTVTISCTSPDIWTVTNDINCRGVNWSEKSDWWAKK